MTVWSDSPVTESVRYRRRLDLLVRLAPGFVALARVDGTLVTLADSGAAVWGLLDEPRTVDEIAEVLAHDYDADPDRIAADIRPLLEQLTTSGFVTADA